MDIPYDPLIEFNNVFPADLKNPYPKSRVDQILRNRQLLDGELFFDSLLKSFARIKDGMATPLCAPPPPTNKQPQWHCSTLPNPSRLSDLSTRR